MDGAGNFSFSLERERSVWVLGVCREFAELGVAVVMVGPLRLTVTWPVGFVDDAKQAVRFRLAALSTWTAGICS